MTHLKRQKLISSTQVRGPVVKKQKVFYIYICSFCTYFTLFLLDTLVWPLVYDTLIFKMAVMESEIYF